MSSSEASIGGPLLQCVLEWQISGALDGATVADGIEVTSNIVTQKPESFGDPLVIEVPGPAGIFNPDGLGGNAARADRYIQWVRLIPATGFPIPAGFRLQIVDVSGLVPSVGAFHILEQLQAGAFDAPAFYIAEMNMCPQGGAVRVDGLAAPPPGAVHRLSMGLRMATNAKDDPKLDQASCCFFNPVAQAQIANIP